MDDYFVDCPYCDGHDPDCFMCQGTGYVTKEELHEYLRDLEGDATYEKQKFEYHDPI